jgi:hypothetical protein
MKLAPLSLTGKAQAVPVNNSVEVMMDQDAKWLNWFDVQRDAGLNKYANTMSWSLY